MNVITICNPYPELILLGEKPIENRPHRWNYRGQLFIHAGKSRSWMTDDDQRRYPNLPFGAIVGVCNLVECLEMSAHTWPSQYQHLKDHEHANGPWCLILADVRRFKQPVPARGALGLWRVPADLQPAVLDQLKEAA